MKDYIDWIDGRHLPEDVEVVAHTWSRMDPFGGTVDMNLFHIMSYRVRRSAMPQTLNWAYDKGMIVRLRRLNDGLADGVVRVNNLSLRSGHVLDVGTASFSVPETSLVAATSYFAKVKNVDILIDSEIPPRSGMGMSGALTSALLLALLGARQEITGDKVPHMEELVPVAHFVEHLTGISLTGYQDQAASLLGGVCYYQWSHPSVSCMEGEDFRGYFRREELLNGDRLDELNALTKVYYSGQSHSSVIINQKQIRSMIEGTHRDMWLREAEIAGQARRYLRSGDYEGVIALLRETHRARSLLLPPDYTNEFQKKALEIAEKHGGAGRVAGAGRGGCCFTLAPNEESAERMAREIDPYLTGARAMLPVRVNPFPARLDIRRNEGWTAWSRVEQDSLVAIS